MVNYEVSLSAGKVLGVIPARAGSRGIPGKNLRELKGKPLIVYSIEEGLRSRFIDRLIVSTDSPEIARVASRYRAWIPFIRPAELSGDDVPMMPVLKHAVEALEEEGLHFETVVCLQPTSPFRKAMHIDSAVERYFDGSCDVLVSVCPVKEHPFWMVRVEGGAGRPYTREGWSYTSRQKLPELFRLNGAIYVFSRDIIEARSTLPDEICVYEMSERDSVDIDDEFDWLLAETILRESNEYPH